MTRTFKTFILLCLLLLGAIGGAGAQAYGVTGPVFWVKADSITPVSNGASIPSWADSSPSAITVSQATAANQPTYIAAGPNGKPALNFTGNQWLKATNPTVFNTLQGGSRTFHFVVSFAGYANGTYPAPYPTVMAKASNGGQSTWFMVQGQSKLFRYSGPGTAGTVSDNQWHIATFTATTTSEQWFLDGVPSAAVAGSPGADTTSDLGIGATGSGAYGMVGKIAEVLVFPRVESIAERAAVESALATKYGIPTTVAGADGLAILPAKRTAFTPTTMTLIAPAPTGGTAPYTYQWTKDGSSAGTSSLTFTDTGLTAGSSHAYSLTVTDAAASVATTPTITHTTPAANTLSVAFIGDSITAASDQADLATWLKKFDGIRSVTLTNTGVSSSTTDNWIPITSPLYQQALPSILAANPAYCMVMLGTNDSSSSVTASVFSANISAICTDLLSRGITPILNYQPYNTRTNSTGPTPAQLLVTYESALDSLSNGTTIFSGDKLAYNWFFNNQSELGDGTHPNGTGYISLSTLWLNAIDKVVIAPGRPPSLFNIGVQIKRGR